jgi:hypothetical protein
MGTQITFTTLLKKDGKILLIKILLLQQIKIFINMGRPKKNIIDKKIKVSISLDRNLYDKIKLDNLKPSRIIEKLIREYYGN